MWMGSLSPPADVSASRFRASALARMPRTGRRPGAAERGKILAAARAHFAKVVTSRDGPRHRRRRGCRPVSRPHYFGRGGSLSRRSRLSGRSRGFHPRLLAPGLDGLGERLVHFFLETWIPPPEARSWL